jgi:hypothetical protein
MSMYAKASGAASIASFAVAWKVGSIRVAMFTLLFVSSLLDWRFALLFLGGEGAAVH